MTFFEVLWQDDSFSDAADLDEALASYLAVKPEGLEWSEVCGNPAYAPSIRRYRSFDSYLDNDEALEVIEVSAAMLEAAEAQAAQAPPE